MRCSRGEAVGNIAEAVAVVREARLTMESVSGAGGPGGAGVLFREGRREPDFDAGAYRALG